MTRTVPDLLLHACDACPEKKAVLQGPRSMTYGEACGQSLRLARFLEGLGVAKGDRVCFWLEKRFEKIVTIFGASMAGAVFVPIRRLSTPGQALHILNDSGAKVLVTTENRASSLASSAGDLTFLRAVIAIGTTAEVSPSGPLPLLTWEEALESPESPRPRTRLSEHDLGAILYTSGSTGRPKGVVLSHLNIMAGTGKVSEYLKITADDRLLSILTFGFDYGLNQLTTAFAAHARIVLLDYLFPRDIVRAVGAHGITGLAAVAATWIQLLQVPWENTAMARLRYVTNSGGAIPAHLVRELRRRLPDTEIFLMYGLTEAFRSTFLSPELVNEHPASIGRAIPGEEILVLDEHDRPVKPGQPGELVHRGPLVSQGYWNDPELTRARFRPNPLQAPEVPLRETVVYSGDRVRVDEQGLLYFLGRTDEMIKCAGNRISPTEVEEVLYRCAGVADAVAFGVPHETYGQAVYAVVSPSGPAACGAPDVLKHCREQMPPYMVPGEVELWDSLPRNENGKLDRVAVRRAVFASRGYEDHPEGRPSPAPPFSPHEPSSPHTGDRPAYEPGS